MSKKKHLFYFYFILYIIGCFSSTGSGKYCSFNKDRLLERHNDFRTKHNVNPLNWSEQLESLAKSEAKLLEKELDCTVSPKQINTNYFTFLKNDNIESAVNSWYEGINDYDFELGAIKKNDSVFEFTQIIWKSVENVGCALACCKSKKVLLCKYDNYANRPGYFADNVLPIDKKYVFEDVRGSS